MAITVKDLDQPKKCEARTDWLLNATSSDLSGCEELKAAPGAGSRLFIEWILINTASSINVTIGEGESSSAVETVLLGPVYHTANTPGHVFIDFRPSPVSLTANKSLTADANTTGATCIIAKGFTI